MEEFDHPIPNTELTNMNSVGDAVAFFSTPVSDKSSYEDMTKLNLPKNLHIQLDPLRFDAETDTFFDGKTAFSGRPTIVSSLKYKRKYKGNNGKSRDDRHITNYEYHKMLEADRQKYRKKHLPSEGVVDSPMTKKGGEYKIPII